jgi:hypothetical protein
MKKIIIQVPVLGLFATFFLLPLSLRAQGSLTPPGAPGPTMKTLAQIEARTPVDATNTPGNANAQYVITQPGSYYLTGNLVGATNGSAGILIQATDAVLDLNGFELLGTSNIGVGIVISGFGARNIVIRNGSLRNWNTGISGDYCDNGELDDLRVYGSENDGFNLRNSWSIKRCTAMGCVNGAGVQLGDSGVLTDCVLSSNYDGLFGGKGFLVSRCLAATNSNDGFVLTDDYNVSQCTAYSSGHNGFTLGKHGQIRDCTAYTNSATGISALVFAQVKGCSADANSNGIVVADDSVVVDNQAGGNGNSGITSSGAGSRLDGNQTPNNGAYGIDSLGGGGADIIIRNTSSGNATANYYPTSGNTFAPVQLPNSATASPWANF